MLYNPPLSQGLQKLRGKVLFCTASGKLGKYLEKVNRLFAKTLKRWIYSISLANVEETAQSEALNCQRFHMYF